MESCIYFSVRKCIPATWLNDRDQFLYPNEGYLNDDEFQLDCLAYALFSNNVRSEGEVNYWIPFIEQEVDAKEKFKSHFMSTYVQKKLQNKLPTQANIWEQVETAPLSFSPEAQSVFDSGRALWRYYHAQPDADPNAALYDIRLYFQGVNEKGKMNADSDDEHYMMLITTLRQNLKLLAKKIEPKVYEYGFLLK